MMESDGKVELDKMRKELESLEFISNILVLGAIGLFFLSIWSNGWMILRTLLTSVSFFLLAVFIYNLFKDKEDKYNIKKWSLEVEETRKMMVKKRKGK